MPEESRTPAFAAKEYERAWAALCQALSDEHLDAMTDIVLLLVWRVATTTTGIRSMANLKSMANDTIAMQIGHAVDMLDKAAVNHQRNKTGKPELL